MPHDDTASTTHEQADEGHTGSDSATPRDDGPEADQASDEGTQGATSARPILDAALAYRLAGWAPTPTLGKQGLLPGWQDAPFPSEDEVWRYFTDPTRNVAVRTGQISGGLIDVDLDSPRAVALAGAFLPKTEAIFGRPSKQKSHWLYQRSDAAEVPTQLLKGSDNKVIVEIRGDRRLTIFPPSKHEGSGEPISLSSAGMPTPIRYDALERRVHALAAAVMLGDALEANPGNRHDFIMALAAGMAEFEADRDMVARIVAAACRTVPDADEDDLAKAVDASFDAVAAGKTVRGFGTAHATVGTKWLRLFRRYTGTEEPDDRVRIDAGIGNLNEQGNRALAALAAANSPEYLFRGVAGPMVRVEHDSGGRPHLAPVTVDALRYEIAEVARFERTPKATKANPEPEPVEVPVPRDVALNVLSRAELPLPWIEKVAPAPVFGPDRVLRIETGFHRSALVWIHADGLKMPAVTGVDVGEAVSLLRELVVDFPFESESDRAHAIALAIQPFGRRMIEGRSPIYMIEKPTPGTGGSLLAEVVTSIFAGPGGATPTAQPEDEAEFKKVLLAKAAAGDDVVFLDNLRGPLDSGIVAAAVTTGLLEGRLLGGNLMATVRTPGTWIVTANNPTVSTEIARRCVQIRLDAKVDRPFERADFQHALPAWADEKRERLIWAALEMWQGWLRAGRPAGKASLGGFEGWAKTLGGVLEHAGIEGFLANSQAFYETADVEGASWRAVVAAWWERFGSVDVTARDLLTLEAVEQGITFKSDRPDKAGPAFGRMLAAQKDRWYGPLKVHHVGTNRLGIQSYRLVHREGVTKGESTPSVAPHQARRPFEDDLNPFATVIPHA